MIEPEILFDPYLMIPLEILSIFALVLIPTYFILEHYENRGESKGQDIGRCLKKADYIIINDGSEEDLKNKLNKIIA